MGMYDYIKCEYSLPDDPPIEIIQQALSGGFQTKDTDAQYLETYTITKDGKIFHQEMRYEVVPENERPYYNNPRYKNSILSFAGSIESIPTNNVELTDFHGDLRFYTSKNNIWYEYIARFNNGTLQYIERVPN